MFLNWIVQFQRVLRLSGGRRVVFDNMTTDEGKKTKQVQDLLVHVAAIERETDGNPFTDKMHRRIQVKLQLICFHLHHHFLVCFAYIEYLLMLQNLRFLRKKLKGLKERRRKLKKRTLQRQRKQS